MTDSHLLYAATKKCATVLTLFVNAGCERPDKSKHRMQFTSLTLHLRTFALYMHVYMHASTYIYTKVRSFHYLVIHLLQVGSALFLRTSLPSYQLDQSSGASCNGCIHLHTYIIFQNKDFQESNKTGPQWISCNMIYPTLAQSYLVTLNTAILKYFHHKMFYVL